MKLLRESWAPLALGIAIGLSAGGAIPVVIGRLNFNDPGVTLGLGVALGGIISILSSWGFSWWYFRKGGLMSAIESAQRKQIERLVRQSLNQLQEGNANRVVVTETKDGQLHAAFQYVADVSTPSIRVSGSSPARQGPAPPPTLYDRQHEQPDPGG